MRDTITWQRCEGAAVLAAGLALWAAGAQPFGIWLAVLVFFAPDLSFAAYLAGPRIGAFAYNLVHSYGTGLALTAAGALASQPALGAVGLLWLMHAGFDRMLGYGLKSSEGFKITHLGQIGPAR